MMRILFILFVSSCLGGCAKGWDDVPASATAPTKELPCGNDGVVCTGTTGAFNDTCCWENQVCPGAVGCARTFNACCDVAPFDPSMMVSRMDGGATSSFVSLADGGVLRVTPRQAPRPVTKP
jgi:hypothetical protein